MWGHAHVDSIDAHVLCVIFLGFAMYHMALLLLCHARAHESMSFFLMY